jgi:hypothetical protein
MPGKGRDRAAVMADWVPASADPPPGSVGSDRDGSKVYFGCDFWTPDKEGQVPAVVPPPTTASRQHPDRCQTCGSAFGADYRRMPEQTCAGCLVSSQDGRLNAEVVRDECRAIEKAEREAAERDALNYAQKKHGKS